MNRSVLSAAIESLAGPELDGIHAAAIALQDPDGHIQLEFAAEDAIDLQTPPTATHQAETQLPGSPRQEREITSRRSTAEEDSDELLSVPPLMSICILIVGTHGDVQPFVAIARRLQEDGHRVRLATHAVYREFVEKHGIEFYPLGGDPKELAAYMVKTGGNLIPTKIKTLTEDVPRNMQMINEIVLSTWPAVSKPDPDGGGPGIPGAPFRAQAIIANPVSYGHVHVAERLGVPLHMMFPQPWVPTMAFPHPLANLAYTGKWQKRNYLSYKMVDLIMWQGTEGVINEFRRDVLKLHPVRNGDSGSELLLDLAIPHSFMWSPKLVPKPEDWGDLYDVIGTVTLEGAASRYSPTPELETFLSNDGGPIFVGFGSMVLADPLATTQMIVDAAKQANVRILIQSSWSDMAGDLEIPDNVFFLGNCPHDWLMPRVCAVVHHGGAGTTAAGLLAGKPTFIVPFFGDQPFWGQAVVSAGVGVAPCPIAQLSTDVLCKAFVELASPELRKRAEALRDLMQEEDGAGEAVRSFYHHLPKQDMWCDLDHQRIATQWSVDDKLKLCDRCAFVVKERPGNQKKKIIRYSCVDYSARGPSSLLNGVATGAVVFANEVTGGITGVLLEPAKGLMYGGVVGAVKGAVVGVYYLIVRPVHGAVLFADRAAAGRTNAKREEGHRKRNNVFDRHIMAALGIQNGLVDTFCVAVGPNAVDTVIFARRKDRKKMLRQMRHSVKYRYCGRYEAIVQAQQAKKNAAFSDELLPPFSDNDQVRSPPKVAPTAVQPLLRQGSNNIMTAGIKVASPGSRINSSPIVLSSTRLTSTGTVKMNLSIPCESANAVADPEIAAWETYASYQRGRSEDGVQVQQSYKPKSSKPQIPHMNICLGAIGTWNNGVKQFVAMGIKLKELGHRVRVAANECFRTEVLLRGLEFYPLAGAPESIQDFAKLIYESQIAVRAALPGRLGTGVIQEFKELIYSLWPAAYGSDPHGDGTNIPGKHFRADSLLWHPLLLGHVHVAERLGIPLQCVSLEPLSPTYYFPHPLSSIVGLEQAILTACQTNFLSYGIVDTAVWYEGVAQVLTQFRAFIGLRKRCDQPNPLVQWEVPHIYLWNSALLPKPLDWGAELSVVGHVSLTPTTGLSGRQRNKREKEINHFKWPSTLSAFAFQTPAAPVIYFGISTRYMLRNDIGELLQKINAAAAAQEHQVRIIFQTREDDDKNRQLHAYANVLQIPSDLPYARLFQEPAVVATIHWGDSDIMAEGLSAGKPVGICGTHSLQYFMSCVCERARVGLPLIDWRTCSVKSLISTFKGLLESDLRENAKQIATTFDPDQPVCAAVQAFYDNLPLAAMRCDLDASKLARVYDPQQNLKLSLQAYVAIRDKIKLFVPYKPLLFGGNHPPTFSIRDNPGESPRDIKPARQCDGVPLAFDLLESQDCGLSWRSLSCSSMMSNPASLVVTQEHIERFWSSVEEEDAVRKATNVAYERLVKKPHRSSSKREAVMRLFGFKKAAQRRQAERLTAVE